MIYPTIAISYVMELARKYDELSNSNQVNVLGIGINDESAAQWDLLGSTRNTVPTRLMAWTISEEWYPIPNHGTLFLGIVDSAAIKKVVYRVAGDPNYYKDAVLTNGWWRPVLEPIPLASIPGTLEVKVTSDSNRYELAWLIIPRPDHQQIFAEMYDEQIFSRQNKNPIQ